MDQQFRFGDAVHNMHDSGIVFWSNAAESGVLWGATEKVHVVPTNSLTLIPHPDSVRLDWLQTHAADVYSRPADGGRNQVQIRTAGGDSTFAPDVRLAIDQIMAATKGDEKGDET